MLAEHVHAARGLEERGVERAQAVADRVELDAERKRHRRGEHRVLHVVQRTAFERRRNQVRPHQRNVAAAVVQRDHLAVDAGFERAGAATRADVLAHQPVLRVHGHVADDLRVGVARHLEHVRIVGIEHRAIVRHFDHDALDLGELLERVDALQAEVVRLHVEHGADIDFGHAHAGTQQAATRGFQHGDVDLRIGQHHARRHRPGHVALDRALAVDVDAVGGGQAGRVAGHLGDVREHARGRGLAVGAGDRGDRHPRRRARREQHVDDRARDVARGAFARRDVHAEARRGVHLADAAADLVALGDVGDGKSTPPTSRPIARTARTAMSRLSGWMMSVTSVAVPPVERFAVERR